MTSVQVEQALHSIGDLYEVERLARDMSNAERLQVRQERAAPLAIQCKASWEG